MNVIFIGNPAWGFIYIIGIIPPSVMVLGQERECGGVINCDCCIINSSNGSVCCCLGSNGYSEVGAYYIIPVQRSIPSISSPSVSFYCGSARPVTHCICFAVSHKCSG